MASLFRALLTPLTRSVTSTSTSPLLCASCRTRTFTTTPLLTSGHNKWSKIRHDKAINDRKRMQTILFYTQQITVSCKLYGPDPAYNPNLANIISASKKAGVPKEKIEAALARGQGKSTSGASLEPLTYEAIVPPSIALIIEAETESKLRCLQDLNLRVKKISGGPSSSKFFFSRLGRVVFEKDSSNGVDVDRIMDEAIEAGAEDLENDSEENIVVWTQPADTAYVAKTIGTRFNLKALSAGIVWTPNEDTKARLDSGIQHEKFAEMLEQMREDGDVQAIYSNVIRGEMSDEEWAKIEECLSR
ncbi:transcriptional regulator-domain-containing protein [Triangularia setosa]|uniref:Transcriptional regulator-domain-containing protein n=1 Tax=Triangularia setosa TaxID=2587417 RepID=A0AAN6W576_9PEZI|nr:transcriptional regulator-domain-containing protein [Podospora setosa]